MSCCRCNTDPRAVANRYIREAARALQLAGIYFTDQAGNTELPEDHKLNLALKLLSELDIQTAHLAGGSYDPARFKLFGSITPCCGEQNVR